MKKRIKTTLGFLNRLTSSKYFSLIFYVLLFLLIFSYNFTFPIDPDLGWHLRYGQETITRGRPLTQDIFSYTFRGQGIVDSEWLIEIAFYFIFSRWSFLGLALFSAFFTSWAFFLPIIAFPGDLWFKFLLIAWSITGSFAVLLIGARPQGFSLFFFSLVTIALLKYRNSGKIKRIALFPLIFWLWANIHPGFFLGIAIVFLFLALEIVYFAFEKKNLRIVIWLMIVLCFSVFLSNYRPHPLQVDPKSAYVAFFKSLILPINMTDKESLGGITRQAVYEWLPPGSISFSYYILFLCGLVFSIGMYLMKPITKKDFKNILLMLGMIYFSTLYVRNVPYFFLVFIPLALHSFCHLKKKPLVKALFSCLNVAAIIIMVCLILVKLPKNVRTMKCRNEAFTYYCQSFNYPCNAVEFIKREKPQGNMFNAYNWGGFLIWQLPEYPVFIDGRVPGAEIFSEYRKVSGAEKGWVEILKKYNVGWVIIEANSQLENSLKIEEKWKEVYRDKIAVVLVKQ